MKIKTLLEASKKRGKHRDPRLLTEILSSLFWERDTPSRGISDIMPKLSDKYKNLKPDTLEDNLEFLSNIGTPAFLKISKEREGKKREAISVYNNLLLNIDREEVCLLRSPGASGRPRNVYSLDNYYIEDSLSRPAEKKMAILAAIKCRFWKDYPLKCPDPNCKICSANDIEHPPA